MKDLALVRVEFVAVLLLGLASFPTWAVEVPFGLPSSVASVDNPRSVEAADLNGDGHLDVLVASSSDNKVTWQENDGASPPAFTPHSVSIIAAGALSAHAADVDGDGDLDVLVASSDDDRIAWYPNTNGAGLFGGRLTISSAADGAGSVFAGDIDGDGDLDVLSASFNDDKIAWYKSDGGSPPSFTEQVITVDPDGAGPMQGFADGAKAVRAADLDGDGDLDVVSASANNDRIAWYENTAGDGSVWMSHAIISAADGASSVDVADVDGDGDQDVLSASILDDKIIWYENFAGDGSSWVSDTLGIVDGPLSARAADVDGDGDIDVLSASFFDNTIAWHENTAGDGSAWTGHAITTLATGATSAVAADLDGDGDLDVLGAASTDGIAAWHENLTIHRSAFFPEQSIISTNAAPAISVYAADLDRDDDIDVLSASFFDDKIAWHENDGASPPGFTEHSISTTAGVPLSVFAADLDRDGDIDVVSAHPDDKIAWYENDGLSPPGFTEHSISTNAGAARSVLARDVDRDGDMDVLSASFRDDKIAWYENDGLSPPGFTEHSISTAADGAEFVFAADVDGDGDTDVLSASQNDDKIAWYENDGTSPPGFTERSISTTADNARSVFAADVDRDGDVDVLSASIGDGKIAWYENDGASPPGFTSHTITTLASGATGVSATDVDGDGDTDVLSASRSDFTVAWYENDGASPPGFTEHFISTTALGAYSVVAADVDGDGDTDVLSASVDDDKIAWYENRGGQFALATTDRAQGLISNSRTEDLFSVEVTHRGRSGDSDLELVGLEVLLEATPGVPLMDSEANALIQELRVYLDEGSGTFDEAADTLVATVSPLTLASGVQSIPLLDGDPDVLLPFGTAKTYFVVVEMRFDASSQSPASFRMTHLTESSSTAEDAPHDIPLVLEFAANVATGPIDALLSPTTSCTAPFDLNLVGALSVDFPLLCEAGTILTAGGGFQILGPGGDVTFRAGTGVELEDGFSVESGAQFSAEIDPLLQPAMPTIISSLDTAGR